MKDCPGFRLYIPCQSYQHRAAANDNAMRHLTNTTFLCILLSASLPLAAAGESPARSDWMVNPTPYKASVSESKEPRELILDNGLARRVIRLSPNAATVSLKNLVSGEEMIRAVSPEARVTLNGTAFAVGGLDGQKIQNYLKAEWVDEMRDNPADYHFTGWVEAPITERLKWKKRPEWLARDLPWPAPGKHVVLTFAPPSVPGKQLDGPVLFEEAFGKFAAADKDWKITASKSHPRASFSNEGKAGEIMTLPDTAVFAERAWPRDARSVELELDTGDDAASNACGPGLALVADDGAVVHFVARPNQQVFDTPAGLGGTFDRAKPVRLRVRLDRGSLICEAAQGEDDFKIIASIPFKKSIARLRVGKVGQNGGGTDYPGASGDPVRCHLIHIALRGANSPASAAPRADLPVVEVHYEIFDGIPLMSKWLVVKNQAKSPVRVNRFVSDELRLFEAEARGGDCHGPGSERERPNIYVETDMAFGGRMYAAADNHAVKLDGDPLYHTHVNYSYSPPTLLTVAPRTFKMGDGIDPTGAEDKLVGPDQEVAPGGTFESFRAFELLLDSNERERRTLAQRRMYRVIAPWTQENPLMFHKVQSDPKSIREAIDQAAAVGYEMVIMSFGSGFNFESRDRKYWDTYKELADYGKSKGIAIGAYSLLDSRGAGTAADNTQGCPNMYGVMPCLGAQWGKDYLKNIAEFSKYAGLGVFENDGSYAGESCRATNHPFHRGYEDSQWVMWRGITDLYKELKADGVFLNIPDWYFLSGSNKCGMGYRETNWSLPRAEQEIIERQTMFDGTWTKTQSMGWMFVPLSQYHGGGAAATIEPLHQHLPHYGARFANLLGYGVQACYRGPRLFDTEETKALVMKWVTFYKAHREVLDMGDLIHLRRPDGRDWDGIVHVNPQGREKAMGFFYNPLTVDITRNITVPLYYAGLSGKAMASVNGAPATSVTLDRNNSTTLTLTIPAGGHTWVLFTAE